MDMLPSSKNASVLRKEDILPPGRRLAAKAASKSISAASAMEKKTKVSLGSAIDEIYKEWKAEAVPEGQRSPFQHMEALVYKTVKNFRTYQLPISRGREILNDINHPELCLGDVLSVLQSITNSVKSYGFRSVRGVGWSYKALKERAFGLMVEEEKKQDEEEDDPDSSTDDEDGDEMDVQTASKPVPPYKAPAYPVARVGTFARKSVGGRAPPPPLSSSSSTRTTTVITTTTKKSKTKHETDFDEPEAKRLMDKKPKEEPEVPVFIAKTPAISAVSSAFPSFPSLYAFMQEKAKKHEEEKLMSAPKSLPLLFSAFPASVQDKEIAALPSPSPSSPPAPKRDSSPVTYGWSGAVDLPSASSSSSSSIENVQPPPYYPPSEPVPSLPEMMKTIAQIDNEVSFKWNETHSLSAIDDLVRKHNGELGKLDNELIEHWDQLPLCILLSRLFHERTSRSSFHKPDQVEQVIICVLRGLLTGSAVGKLYNPDLQSCRELLFIAERKPLWDALVSVLTFHMRLHKADRAKEREKLLFVRKIMLLEADKIKFCRV